MPTEVGTSAPSPLIPHKPAPRRRLRDRQLRKRRVHPRYNDHEFDLVQRAAAISQMAPGGYVAESSLAAARADDPTAAVADYRATVKALLAANGQLGRVGNNLNQLSGHLNKDGDMPAADTVLRILHGVEASVQALDGAVARVMEGR
ncbi:plasmid mobilization relaxosome protein MobC [Streptomyces sp. NPDC096095]|uniref:plasmid mobilization relaxosome protein MobC n=1 Tax=Streptomyces sp. NPDC096095 TaxID=3155545 RepID=UPI0033275D6C